MLKTNNELESEFMKDNYSWDSYSTEELIELTKKTNPMIYKQLINNGIANKALTPMEFYSLCYEYRNAIIYGISDSIKIDYSLLSHNEIADILKTLSVEIPAFEALLKEYEETNNHNIKESRKSIYNDCKADIKKMKCHIIKINQELKRRVFDSQQQSQPGEEE